jgi:hypothetical protein
MLPAHIFLIERFKRTRWNINKLTTRVNAGPLEAGRGYGIGPTLAPLWEGKLAQ